MLESTKKTLELLNVKLENARQDRESLALELAECSPETNPLLWDTLLNSQESVRKVIVDLKTSIETIKNLL